MKTLLLAVLLAVATQVGAGGSSTTMRFGNGFITNYDDGTTSTTSRFGNGYITNYDDGTSSTTSRFGNGYITDYYGDGPRRNAPIYDFENIDRFGDWR